MIKLLKFINRKIYYEIYKVNTNSMMKSIIKTFNKKIIFKIVIIY